MRGFRILNTLALVAVATGTAGLLALSGCTPEEPSDDAVLEAQALWEAAQPYVRWEPAPGFAVRQPSDGPHGDEIDIFVNGTAAAALEAQDAEEWAVGSIVVLDSYIVGQHSGVVMMEKREEGRYWASYSPAGDVLEAGMEIASCEECHAEGSDGVLSFSLP